MSARCGGAESFDFLPNLPLVWQSAREISSSCTCAKNLS